MASVLGTVLGTAVDAAKGLSDAARDTNAQDIADYNAELKKTQDAQLEQQQILAEKAKETDAFTASTPTPVRPAAPKYEAMPQEQLPPPRNPIQSMIQLLPIMAALGGAKSSEAAAMALNAGAAAMHAMQANDQEALTKAHQTWMDNLKIATENNANMAREYDAAFNDYKADWADRQAKIAEIATRYGDKLAAAALKAGHPEAIVNRNQMLLHATQPLTQIYDTSVQAQAREAAVMEEQRHHIVSEAIAEFKANKPPPPSMNAEAAKIAQKMAAGTPLTDGEKQVWKVYDGWRKGASAGQLAALLTGKGAAADDEAPPAPDDGDTGDGAVAPPAAAAPPPPAAAAPAAAPPSTMPPIDKLHEGVVTNFRNGQSWTLKNGKPFRVK